MWLMTNNIISGYRLADAEKTQRVNTDIRVSNIETEKGCVYSAYRLKYIYEGERKRKRKRYFRIVGCISVSCSGRVSVAFFKRDCFGSRDMAIFFRVWLSGRDDFRRMILLMDIF